MGCAMYKARDGRDNDGQSTPRPAHPGRLAKGRFTVYGSGLRICTLTAARLTVQGQFLRTDFSDE